MKKILCTFAAVLMLLSFMTGCTKEMTVQSLYINGEYIPVETVLEIDSYEVSLFEYRYYFIAEKYNFDSGNEKYWDENPDKIADLMEAVLKDIRFSYAKYQLADDIGVKLKWKNKKNVRDQINELKGEYAGETEYLQLLEELNMDEALLEKFVQEDELMNVVYDYYFGDKGTRKLSDGDVVDYVYENYVHFKQIYIRFDYDGTETNKQLMESILQQLDEGGDFDKLMKKYTRDSSISLYPNGYYTSKNSESETVKKILSIEEDSYSDIFVGSDGYYIFQRLPFDNDVLSSLDDFRSRMELEILTEILNEYVDKQNVKIVSEYYDLISFETLGLISGSEKNVTEQNSDITDDKNVNGEISELLTLEELIDFHLNGAKYPENFVFEELNGYGRVIESSSSQEDAISNATEYFNSGWCTTVECRLTVETDLFYGLYVKWDYRNGGVGDPVAYYDEYVVSFKKTGLRLGK